MGNTATIRAAADIIRANADLLARHGYTVSTVIMTIIAVSHNYDYNPMAAAVRSFADRVHGVAVGLDARNGVTVFGHPRTGLEISVPVGSDNSEANALHSLVAQLYAVSL